MAEYEDITPRELKDRLASGESPLLLDVREEWECDLARIEGSKLVPMGELSERLPELAPEAETVVICHHGARSARVADALSKAGFERVFNLSGGLDAYSDVDSAVKRY